ncbi:MAG: hypothetical protein SYR96_33960 [Actinomycetota bacterium]|nr:hypothetical protein [Actinomycetota bacterium]
MTTDTPALLAATTARLAARFDGVHTNNAVARYVADSCAAPHRTVFADRLAALAPGGATDQLPESRTCPASSPPLLERDTLS